MKRIALIFAVVIFLAACANPQAVEIPEISQEDYMLSQNLTESKTSEPAEFSMNVRPHHYGSFSGVGYGSAGSLWFYETTLSGLESRASSIVRARMLDDAEIISQFNDRADPTQPSISHNVVSIEILEVIKGDLTVGETKRIIEPYYIVDGTFYTWRYYMPSIPHQEYIFFLGSQNTHPEPAALVGTSWVLHGERSRFPVPDNAANIHAFSADTLDFNSDIFGLGSGADVEVYMHLWVEVMNEWVAAGE